MIVMEGLLLVPPERGTIIGRAVWKPRYVMFGTGATIKAQAEFDNTPKGAAARKAALKSSSSRPSLVDVSQDGSEDDGLYVAIYKAKGDWELISQHHIASFKSCEIRALAHRKQSPTIPTLMMETKADPTSEKSRKRRSSRTGGLTSSKDPWAGILLFRTAQDERYNIYDWQVMIKPQLTPESADDSPISPGGPFHALTSSFSTSQQPRHATRPERMPQQTNSYPHAPRERPSAMISPSPSLRSRRSDLSSQASSQHPPLGFTSAHSQNYSTLPQDLPSPASTSYEPHSNDGWNSTQGRSSALSSHSHTRQSNSIASAIAPTSLIASTPPGPRETILDRAFQMRVIPGSDRVAEKDGDKLSSLARFEALMREDDERKQQKGAKLSCFSKDAQEWNLDEESEEDSDFGEPILHDDDSDEPDGLGMELSDDDVGIPATAQQLEYISGRRTPIPSNSRPLSPAPNSPPVPFLNPQAMRAFHASPSTTNGGGLRPRTGTNTSRNNDTDITPSSLLDSRSASATSVPRLKDVST